MLLHVTLPIDIMYLKVQKKSLQKSAPKSRNRQKPQYKMSHKVGALLALRHYYRKHNNRVAKLNDEYFKELYMNRKRVNNCIPPVVIIGGLPIYDLATFNSIQR